MGIFTTVKKREKSNLLHIYTNLGIWCAYRTLNGRKRTIRVSGITDNYLRAIHELCRIQNERVWCPNKVVSKHGKSKDGEGALLEVRAHRVRTPFLCCLVWKERGVSYHGITRET